MVSNSKSFIGYRCSSTASTCSGTPRSGRTRTIVTIIIIIEMIMIIVTMIIVLIIVVTIVITLLLMIIVIIMKIPRALGGPGRLRAGALPRGRLRRYIVLCNSVVV